MLTADQTTVFNWIKDELNLPVHAEVYSGAVDILNKKSPGYITFVSHAGRDLMNTLVSAFKGITSSQVQYVQRVDAFKDDWRDEWGGEGFSTPTDNAENGHLIPHEVCEKIKKLVDEHKEGRSRAENTDNSFFTAFLGYQQTEGIPEDILQEWRKARRWFVDHVHLREEEFDESVPDELEQHFRNLDNFLHAAARSESDQLRSLHEILEDANQ